MIGLSIMDILGGLEDVECIISGTETPEDDVALEMELARWRRENPLPEPEDDGRPW